MWENRDRGLVRDITYRRQNSDVESMEDGVGGVVVLEVGYGVGPEAQSKHGVMNITQCVY